MQYARSKVDYMISEFICMLPSDMNLWIGNVRNYNNKILISSPSFKIGTNVKINLNGGKDKPDVKSKEVEMVKSESDVKPKVIAKPNIEPNEKHNQDVKPNDIHQSDLLSLPHDKLKKKTYKYALNIVECCQ